MLVNNTYQINDIIALKLVNGDEIIAKLAAINDDIYTLERPCVVLGSAKGIALMQAMFSLDPEKSVKVRSEHVMMTCEAMAQMRDHYIQVTTGIQPVSKGSIII
jgi:hypothetical protein